MVVSQDADGRQDKRTVIRIIVLLLLVYYYDDGLGLVNEAMNISSRKSY